MSRLLTIKTDLSDYKAPQYGYDRPGAGPRNTNASGQPYELVNIPKRTFTNDDFNKNTNPEFRDFILRGGQLLPETVATDASRLVKMFADLKSPNGLLFTGKQEVLSRTSVNIKAVGIKDARDNKLPFNNGVYLPTSTILQSGVNSFGGHLLKQGINPFFDTSESSARGNVNNLFSFLTNTSLPLSNPIYFETVAFGERTENKATSRLVQFLDKKINKKENSNILYEYSGGPGSILGVGKTKINIISSTRTGKNNAQLIQSGFFTSGATKDTNYGYDFSVFGKKTFGPDNDSNNTPDDLPFNFRGGTYFGNIEASGSKTITGKYSVESNTPLINLLNNQFQISNDNLNPGVISNVGQSVYQSGSFQENSPGVKGLGSALSYNQLMEAKGIDSVLIGDNNNEYPQPEILEDFRRKTTAPSADSLGYLVPSNRYEQRTNLGTAGKKNQTTSYRKGNNEALDEINSLQIYKASNVDQSKPINDLCKFRIGVIDNDNPSLKTYIHFRAFLDSMNDNYTAEWESQKFTGRAENFYKYKGFNREFNIDWTVTAQSKQELIPMYQKLNYLASVCAPDYSANGYMRGNLIELTVGGYLYNQVGIMMGVNYTVPMESPWEIAIGDQESINKRQAFRNSINEEFLDTLTDNNLAPIQSDSSVKELPHMIKVSGFKFIPIHNFVPNIQKNIFTETNEEGPGTLGDLSTFGPERYIALSNGFTTNY